MAQARGVSIPSPQLLSWAEEEQCIQEVHFFPFHENDFKYAVYSQKLGCTLVRPLG